MMNKKKFKVLYCFSEIQGYDIILNKIMEEWKMIKLIITLFKRIFREKLWFNFKVYKEKNNR
jgi:hypothetical protein